MSNKIILKNGLRVVMAPMKGTKTVTVLFLVKAGSRYEKAEENGLAHFIEHMFFKGTKKRPNKLEIPKLLDGIGAEYNAFTSKEFTGYYVKSASEHLKLITDVASDVLINLKLPAKEIEKERGVIVEEINMYEDTPMYLVGNLFEKLLYQSSSLGRPILGTKANVMNFQRKDFLNFFKTHYHSANSVIVIAGNLSKKEATKLSKKYFLDMKENKPSFYFPFKKSKQKKPQVLLKYKQTDQSHLCLGVKGYDIFHPDRYVLKILATILGGYFSSRIIRSLREKEGLAYYAETSSENYSDAGYLVTQAGVPNKKIEKAIKIILKEYKDITAGKFSEAEIKRAKKYLKGKTLISLESSDRMASWIGTQEILKEEILPLEKIFAKINKVKKSDIKRVARDIFTENKLNLALIGPFQNKEKFKKLLKI